MGRAARLNPRSSQWTGDPDEHNLIVLRRMVAQLPTREAFERWLLGFEPDHRPPIRAMLQSAGRWTVENRRKALQVRRANWREIRQRARAMARKVID